MAQRSTVTINTKTAESIFKELETMKKSLDALQKKVMELLPMKYGNDAWWKKTEGEADEDIKKGRVHGPFKNTSDLLHALHK